MSGARPSDDLRDFLASLDLRSPDAAARLFRDAAHACRSASCRRGSVDDVPGRGLLFATGDLHDNPVNLAKILELARPQDHSDASPRHLVLHEVIHGGSLMQGMDMSHRALARIAALKARFAESVHILLANHELSQIAGAGVVKDGVRMNEAFDEGVRYAFGADADAVLGAIHEFVRAMPLALTCRRGSGRAVLCAHSLPPAELMDRFDLSVLDRDLTEDDYTPRRGAAHIMVWGRRHGPEHLDTLAAAWGVDLFLIGHEKAEDGWLLLPPRAVVLNSDHARAAAMRIDLADPPAPPLDKGSVGPLVIHLADTEGGSRSV